MSYRRDLLSIAARLSVLVSLASCAGMGGSTSSPRLTPIASSGIPLFTPMATRAETATASASTCGSAQTQTVSGTLAVADDGGIILLPVGGATPLRLTDNQFDGPPTFSPDGRFLAYSSLTDYSSGNTDLFLLDLSSSSSQALTNTPLSELYPAWSFDGRYLAFEADIQTPDGKHRREVQYIDVVSGAHKSLQSPAPFSGEPAWSPTWHKLAFLSSSTPSGSSGSDLYVYDLSDKSITKLTTDSGVDKASWPKWSPDGKAVLVAFGPTGRFGSDLVVIDAGNGDLTRLTEGGMGYGQGSWSPDGEMIAFTSVVDGRGRILTLGVGTKETHVIFDDPGFHAGSPIWSPDGRALGFVFTEFSPTEYGGLRYGKHLSFGLIGSDGCFMTVLRDGITGGVRVSTDRPWSGIQN